MSTKNILRKAEALFHQGKFEKAIEICKKVLEKKPKLFDARQILALSYQNSGEVKLALDEFEKALLIKANDPHTNNNIGNIYLDLKQYDLALKHYHRALNNNPSFAEAWNNLATCQLRTGNKTDAEANFRKAIRYAGNVSQFHSNLAEMLIDQGDFDKALKILLTSQELDNSTSNLYRNVFSIFMYQHRYQDAIEIADIGLLSENLSESELCELLVSKAILFWLFDNHVEAAQAIRLSEAIYKYRKNSVELNNLCTFHGFIKQILELNKSKKPNENIVNEVEEIYFISESHGFTANDNIVNYRNIPYKVRSLFILGAKVLHLIQEGSNKHKQSLSILFDGLPENSKVVMGVGEIDCRRNEGIFVHCLKHGLDYRNVIDEMLVKYIEILTIMAKPKGIEFILYGVPAPHKNQVNLLEQNKQDMFKELIKYFNYRLQSICQENNISFLNVYSLTEEEGISNLKYHIDNFHLSFNAVPTLFEMLQE